MSRYVLDASAVIAVLNGENGASRVEELLSESLVSSVNLAEVLTKSIEAGHTIKTAVDTLAILELNVVAFDETQSRKVAELRPLTRKHGLSLGDRSCLALAILYNAIAVTADRNWKLVKVCPVELIR
jgi:ribonuclease VapC